MFYEIGDMTIFLWIPKVENFSVVEFCVGKKCLNRQKEAVKCLSEQQSQPLW